MKYGHVLALGLTLVIPAAGWGWSDFGHEAVMIVAFRHCKPETKKKIQDILDHQSLVFKDPVQLATWADKIRDNPAETHPTWHYADYGFSISQGIPAVKPEADNAEIELTRLIESIPKATGEEAAREMAWLFHLVGDIHQPLHASSLSSRQLPRGDKGGNDFMVIADTLDHGNPQHASIRLHTYWDRIFDINQRGVTPESIANEADQGDDERESVPTTPEARKEMIHDWMIESSKLAQAEVYRKDGPSSPYLEQNGELPDTYLKRERKLALKRIKAAGYRMAALLDYLYK